MADTHPQQRTHSTATPTRGRAVRPIRFTPTRTERIAPPPLESHASSEQSSLASRFAAWTLVAAGWAVFIAWWVIVLRRETIQSLGFAFGILAATLVVSAIGTALWTAHNIRIARRGKRGKSSLFIPMIFERDTLGRPLAFPTSDGVRTAAEVRVVIRDGVKAYVVPSGEEL